MRTRTDNCSLIISPEISQRILDEILDRLQEESFECIDKCFKFVGHMIETALIMNIDKDLNSMILDIKVMFSSYMPIIDIFMQFLKLLNTFKI